MQTVQAYIGSRIFHQVWRDNSCLINSINAIFGRPLILPGLAYVLETDNITRATLGVEEDTVAAILGLRGGGWSLETGKAICQIAPKSVLQWINTSVPRTAIKVDDGSALGSDPSLWFNLGAMSVAADYSRFEGNPVQFEWNYILVQVKNHYYTLAKRGDQLIKVDGLIRDLPTISFEQVRSLVLEDEMAQSVIKTLTFFKFVSDSSDLETCVEAFKQAHAIVDSTLDIVDLTGSTDTPSDPKGSKRKQMSLTSPGMYACMCVYVCVYVCVCVCVCVFVCVCVCVFLIDKQI
jgi:hypothetical protein